MAMRRFEIAQESMLPNLRPGQEIVAVDTRQPGIGDVVVFEHPERDDFWLVKRVAIPPHPIAEDQAWVSSDNPDVTRADSRTLGPVARQSLWTAVERLDPSSFTEACQLLAEEDETLAKVLDEHGLPVFWKRDPGLPTLVWLILEQQVSLESGAEMYRRVHSAAGSVTAESLLDLGSSGLRSIGVTRQKTSYLLALAEAIVGGDLSLSDLGQLPQDRARASLLELRGIGPWTADAYLLSALRFPDVFPVGDRALQVGVAETLGLQEPPDEEQLETLSQPWRPVRAAAARIIWHGYLSGRDRIEPSDPTLTHGDGRDA
jgi:DNA-3-methyladenine glycosylase II